MASCAESLAPQVARRIAREVADMIKSPPEGITILPNESDISDVQAIIYGPAGTPYAGGQFRVKLVLGREFPSSPPSGFFLTRIFHPNVSQKGEICVNTLKKDWKPEYGVKHILLIVKCLLIVPNPESALNEEAAKLLLEHYDEYYARAQMVTEIHAQPTNNEKENCQGSAGDDAKACTGKHAGAQSSVASAKNAQGSNHKATLAVSKTINKDKKRLKRL